MVRLEEGLALRLADASIGGSPRVWLIAWVSAVAASFAIGATVGGPVLALIAGTVSMATPTLALAARRGRSAAAADAALPAALESIAASMRAGTTLPLAIASAAVTAAQPLGDELSRVSFEAGRGGLVAAADAWAARCPRPSVRLAAAAIALSAEVGGAGARALDGVALTVRRQREARGEVRALGTQARLSAVVLGLAPIAFAALAAAADPRTLRFLLVDGAGQICLVAGLALDSAGVAWMARITRAGAR